MFVAGIGAAGVPPLVSASVSSGATTRRVASVASLGSLAVLLVGGILGRRDPLGPPSLWLDDAWPALAHRAEDTWEAIQTAAFSAPGFIALLTGWLRTVGFSEQAAQMPAFIAGALGAPVAFWLFRRLRLPAIAAAVAAACMLVGPAHLDFSTRVKPYTLEALMALAVVGAGWALTRRPGELRPWVRLTAVAVPALALSAATVPVIAGAYVAGAHALIRRRRLPWTDPDAWIGPALSAAVLQAFAGLWWILFLRRAASNKSLVADWSEGFVDRSSLSAAATSSLDIVEGSLRAVSPLHPLLTAVLLLAALAAMVGRAWFGPVVLLSTTGLVAFGLALVGRVPLGGFRTDTWATSLLAVTLGGGVAAALPRSRRLAVLRDLGPPGLSLVVVAALALGLPAAGHIANPYPSSDIDELVTVAEVARRPGDVVLVHTASVWAFSLYSEADLRLVADEREPNGFHPALDDRRTILLRPARDPRMVFEPRLGPILDRVTGERRLCLVATHYNRYWNLALNRIIADGLVIESEIRRDGGTLVCWHRPQ